MNFFKNFEFGAVKNSEITLSHMGIAVKNAEGDTVVYDASNGNIVSVDGMTFDIEGGIYKMPCSIKEIKVGDVICHMGVPMFVISIAGLNGAAPHSMSVIDPKSGEKKDVLPTKSMFGFDFVTKYISLFNTGGIAETASEENPFGNMMLPLLLSKGSGNIKDIMPLLLMGSGNNLELNNPMMLMFLMGINGDCDGGSEGTENFYKMILMQKLNLMNQNQK